MLLAATVCPNHEEDALDCLGDELDVASAAVKHLFMLDGELHGAVLSVFWERKSGGQCSDRQEEDLRTAVLRIWALMIARKLT